MSLFIQISDFKGETNLSKDKFTKNDLQYYIDKFEVIYLQDLLGAKLYKEFKTDFAISGTGPTAAKFIEIWNAFAMDESCGIVRSEGMLGLLSLFIYFEYLRDQPIENNIAGPQRNIQANSETPSWIDTNIYTTYNDGIKTYNAIQWLICDNPNGYDWSDYNGVRKESMGIV